MTDTTHKTARWKTWLLIASLALNLAFIGLIAGVALRGKPDEQQRAPGPDMIRELVRAVPNAHRDALRDDLRAKKGEMRVIRAQMRETRSDLVGILGSPEFDVTRVVALFEDHRVVLSRMTKSGHEIIIRRIERMTAEDRQVFAQNIRKVQEKRGAPK